MFFTKRYRVEYLAYAHMPELSFWAEFDDGFYTMRGAINKVKKTLLMRIAQHSTLSKYRIIDTRVAPPIKKIVAEIEVTTP